MLVKYYGDWVFFLCLHILLLLHFIDFVSGLWFELQTLQNWKLEGLCVYFSLAPCIEKQTLTLLQFSFLLFLLALFIYLFGSFLVLDAFMLLLMLVTLRVLFCLQAWTMVAYFFQKICNFGMRGWNGQCSSCIILIVFCLYFFQSDQWTGGWSGVPAAWLVWSPVQVKHQGSFAFTNCLYIEVIRLLLFYQISHVSVWISNLNFGSPILSFDQIFISVKQTIWYVPNYIDFCEPSLPLPYNILGVWCVYNLPSLCWYMDIRLCFSLMISIFCCLFLYLIRFLSIF